MKTIKYSYTPEEYWEMEIYGLENVKSEFQKQYLEEAKKRLEKYMIDKNKFESMNDDEKRKIILRDLIDQTKNHSNELFKINYVFRFGKYHQSKDTMINEYDTQYEKTQFILYELKEKIKHFITNINNRSDINVTRHPLNPSLTSDEINKISFQMMCNELLRLEQNIANYNFFLNVILSLNDSSHNFKVNSEDFMKIKTTCLMFLLNCDYENNKSSYQNFEFSSKLMDSIIVRESMIDNGNGQMIKDRFTIKADSREIHKIIRDAASHGEYYYQDNSIIRVENSEDIPRISMNICFEELCNFIITNLSDETKEKYK